MGPPEPACPVFAPGEARGIVETDALPETSGLAVVGPRLWVHNDSGSPLLYALRMDGSLEAAVTVSGVDRVVDWEDIAFAGDTLYIGDIGDNLQERPTVSVIAVPVPDAPADGDSVDAEVAVLAWPTGATDAETLLADPVSGDVLVASKAFDGITVIARAQTPLRASVVLEEVARLQFGEDPLGPTTLVTGGAVAPDGDGVVLRTYLGAFAWPRVPGEPWADTFARVPCPVALQPEAQGEAIGWGPQGLWTLSEFTGATLWHYAAVSSSSPAGER